MRQIDARAVLGSRNGVPDRLPVTVVFAEEFEQVADAYALEKRIQGWSRAKREALIESRYGDLPQLSKKNFVKPRPSPPPE